jgi:hypothetical protein
VLVEVTQKVYRCSLKRGCLQQGKEPEQTRGSDVPWLYVGRISYISKTRRLGCSGLVWLFWLERN